MSDSVIIVISICITSSCITAMLIAGTYLKDRLIIKGKSSIGKLTENEISITAEDKNSKN
ncbi:hypothetical protein [Clostridium sp. BJN0013]|uniref:hypothetical protein n=1 Tax=Clostridium sp. BJN0013 TaxID=3236840 RepID=UPI0034C5BD7A